MHIRERQGCEMRRKESLSLQKQVQHRWNLKCGAGERGASTAGVLPPCRGQRDCACRCSPGSPRWRSWPYWNSAVGGPVSYTEWDASGEAAWGQSGPAVTLQGRQDWPEMIPQ